MIVLNSSIFCLAKGVLGACKLDSAVDLAVDCALDSGNFILDSATFSRAKNPINSAQNRSKSSFLTMLCRLFKLFARF